MICSVNEYYYSHEVEFGHLKEICLFVERWFTLGGIAGSSSNSTNNDEQVTQGCFVQNHQHLRSHMIALWYLLLFCFYFVSWAKPLVVPRLGESLYLASTEFNSHSIPPPPSFLFPSLRTAANVDTSTPMISFAFLPFLAYSTLLAIFGFISVRIARWRRKHRPAALTLDDDDVELLPTNTSTLSPEFKDLPVPPPLPSHITSHARSRSFSNLQHAIAVHDMPERERPKSPLHFGLSSPGSRLKSKQRSHSVGSISSPLSPKRRAHNANSARRPFISDPESEAETLMPQRHDIVSPHSGTLIDLSVTAVPPVLPSSPLNPVFQRMMDSTQLWTLPQPSTVPAEELNLIDLHAPDTDKHVHSERPPISVPVFDGCNSWEAKEQDAISTDLDGYEPDVEGEAEPSKDKEIDIGLEWGFESVSSLSMRVSSVSQTRETTEERDLVDANSLSSSSPVDLLATQLHPISVTASSSLSEGYLQPKFKVPVLDPPAGEIEDPLSISSSSSSSTIPSSSSPSPTRHLAKLHAGRRAVDAVERYVEVEDEDELDFNVDDGTLPSISRDDTFLDSNLIQRVYIDDDTAAGQSDVGPGAFDVHDRDADEHYDIYENNDRVERSEDTEDVESEEHVDKEVRSEVDAVNEIQDDGVNVLPFTVGSTATATSILDNRDSHEVMQDFLTPPPSHDKINNLAPRSGSDVKSDSPPFKGNSEDEPQLNSGEDVKAPEDDLESIIRNEDQFPDPDLLPLPELDTSPLLNTQGPNSFPTVKEESRSVSPTSQIPTPPASPPQQRRALSRPLPAWSIRAADAPPLGLASRSPVLRSRLSFSHLVIESGDARVAKETETEFENGNEIKERDDEETSLSFESGKENDEIVSLSTKTPVLIAATLPGAFPVDVQPLSDVTEPEEEKVTMATTTEEIGSSSDAVDESTAGTSDQVATSSSATSTSISKPTKRHPARSPIDIALAMQLRPGLGLGADPAWMVRFLMAMFGWFVVLISGSAGDGYGRTPYVGIRRKSE
ncbi:hypothetical protein J3R30DRAFT_3404860 [Lentinula aciculospora]|uniref:Transmembrane protein n=1 Tax=Lentinula aciculospora TaxID=153920 RepID=A0A9W9A9A5_9AGAR|nr:hypothetical protein J3R30DRAFT_3404860 [Lentinula aciculospora]